MELFVVGRHAFISEESMVDFVKQHPDTFIDLDSVKLSCTRCIVKHNNTWFVADEDGNEKFDENIEHILDRIISKHTSNIDKFISKIDKTNMIIKLNISLQGNFVLDHIEANDQYLRMRIIANTVDYSIYGYKDNAYTFIARGGISDCKLVSQRWKLISKIILHDQLL